MAIDELLNAVEPFLNNGSTVGQKTLPLVPPLEVAGPSTLSSLPLFERMDSRVVVSANTPLGDIVTTVEPSFSVEGEVSQEGIWRALKSEVGTSGNPATPRVERDEAGPSHQGSVVQNASLESSLRNRIVRLEQGNSPFLLDKGKGELWAHIKVQLDQAASQSEYNCLLDFESRDLQIRERRHDCLSLFQEVLSRHPDLAEEAPYNPREAFVDFLDEKRDELDTHIEWSPAERDRRELQFLDRVRKDIRERGPDSIYMRKALGYA